MKSSSAFRQAYQQLNSQQKLAVDTIEGPVMVIAGPGTGKTQVLATRIANILLKTDTNPYAILALTFTESAAKNMRQRLVQLIGSTAYAVHVQTFHSFCEEVIRSHPEYFPVRQESEVLTDLERYEILETLLKNTPLKVLKTINSPFHFLKPIMKAIADLKRENVSSEQFEKLVIQQAEIFEEEKEALKKTELSRRQKNLSKQTELALIYTLYQRQLHERRRYDYEDMIAFVAEAFSKEESLLLEYQEKLSYFLVDEYQDTNAAQNQVVDLLASYWGAQANLFVVGDPHQSIYRFQGASLENTLSFANRYPTATLISLTAGYRCPQNIYDAAAEVITHNGAVTKSLQSTQTANHDLPIQVYAAPAAPLETIYLAQTIQDLIAAGTPANEIAILYRNNVDAADIQIALEKWQIPYLIDGDNNVLQSPEIQQLFTFCTAIANLRHAEESSELFTIMNYPWLNLDHYLVIRAARAAGQTKMSLYERIQKGFAEFAKLPFCEDISPLEFNILEDFLAKLVRWGQQDAEMTFPDWLELVINESGYLDWILSHANKLTLLSQINAVFHEAQNLAIHDHVLNLDRFLEIIATMREHSISIAVEEIVTQDQAVTLSTVHKAKGREWTYVFLAHCVDGKWGNGRQLDLLPLPDGILRYQPQEQDANEDDRRLFYVALTRAKKQFTVSYSESLVTGNQTKSLMGSLFLTEIADKYKQNVVGATAPSQIAQALTRLVTTTPPLTATDKEKVWLKRLTADFALSATALNTYLRSPEVFVEEILLKVPKATPPYFAFGTAIHSALEQYYSTVIKQQKPKINLILKAYQTALEQAVLTKEEYQMRLDYGQRVLKQYFAHYEGVLAQPVMVERFFGHGWGKTMLGDIQLVGRIDRIDWLDKEQKTLRVIDYKTGRARTINEIEGQVATSEFSERELALPANIRGQYKRQLLFYKLLTQLDKSLAGTVTEGIFDFVEPDRDGKFTRREFPLLDADVLALQELIQQVMSEIRDLKFIAKN